MHLLISFIFKMFSGVVIVDSESDSVDLPLKISDFKSKFAFEFDSSDLSLFL